MILLWLTLGEGLMATSGLEGGVSPRILRQEHLVTPGPLGCQPARDLERCCKIKVIARAQHLVQKRFLASSAM
jgi:hypothetical protein